MRRFSWQFPAWPSPWPAALAAQLASRKSIDLPSSKQLIGEIPGHPQRLNSLPISMAVSPDGRYVVTVNAGYGTFESKYEQSLAVLDTQTGALTDFPDDRTAARTSKADALLRPGLQPRRQAHLRQHGFAHRSRSAASRTQPAAASPSTASSMERSRRSA